METTTFYEPSSGFPIVGIGASAGGLKAFTQLLEQLPAATGMAYVVIQHLDPTHASLLPPLLARVTTMPVHEGLVGPTFQYALKPHGFLLLGISENVGLLSRLFAHVEHHLNLSVKRATEGNPFLGLMKNEKGPSGNIPGEGGIWMSEETRNNPTIQQEVDHLLLANYVPACVIVNKAPLSIRAI